MGFKVPIRATDAEVRKLVPELFEWTTPQPVLKPAARTWSWEEANAELSDDAKARQRFRGIDSGLRASTPELSLGVNFAWWAVGHLGPRRGSRLELLRGHGWLEAIVAENYAEWASWMNNKAKKLKNRLGVDWMLLAEMAGLGGYAPVSDTAFYADVVEWVQGEPRHVSPFRGMSWDFAFRMAVRWVLEDNFDPNRLGPADVKSVEEWAADPLGWALAGSSFDVHGERLFVTTPAGNVKAKNTKWASALRLDPSDVRSRILSETRQAAKAVAKRETKKVRAVISSDLDTYLKMSYLDQWVKVGFQGSTASTLWMNPEQRLDMWYELAAGGSAADIDQDKFDHEATMSMVLTIVEELYRLLPAEGAYDDLRTVFARLHFALKGGFVIVGRERVAIRNGVLSGWLWTALFDTIISLAEAYLAREVVNRSHGARTTPVLIGQGDDVHARQTTVAASVEFVLAYDSMKLKVSKSKTMMDTNYAEFLRRVGDARLRKVVGYPMRAINSILWRNPINDVERPGQARLLGIYDRWSTLCGRLGHATVPRECLHDLASANRISLFKAELWVNTPCAFGGGGYDPRPDHLYLETTTASRSFNGVEVKPALAPGLRAVERLADLNGFSVPRRVLNNWALSVIRLRVKDEMRYGDWDSAEFNYQRWYTAKTPSAPLPRPAVPLTPEQVSLLGIAPSDANCAATGNPRPQRVSLRWWVAYLCGALPNANPRVFGHSTEWSTVFNDEHIRGLAGGFLASGGTRSWNAWRDVLATAEVRALYSLRLEASRSLFMSP